MPTMTITTTGPQATRVVSAFGLQLNLGRDATAAEVKQATIQFLKGVVFAQEAKALRDAIVVPPIDPT